MIENNKSEGCCPSIHAKTFEIILIIGFILSLGSLIVNLTVLFWCIKNTYPLLIILIRLIALSTISLVLSIILRVWRSDDSVFNTKFLSSFCVAIINLVLVIINILSSITEEVLFSFVISIFNLQYFDDDVGYVMHYISYLDDYTENEIRENYGPGINLGALKKAKKYYKTYKMFLNIMKKDFYDNLFEDDETYSEQLKKVKVLKILPWITINFNILIQLLMLIFIIILILKISSKSDLGNPPNETQLSVKNKMLIGKSNGMDESEKRAHKEKKKKKKKKKKKVI